MKYKIVRYSAESKTVWDSFVAQSRNATFLHYRNYMDYHSDRFADCSLMLYNSKGKVVALLPANIREDELFSHEGLTYGGLLLDMKSGAVDVIEMFEAIADYLRTQSIRTLHYKQIPTIYHKYPTQEDEYALWRFGAQIEVCNISSTLSFGDILEPKSQYCRRARFRQSLEHGFSLEEGLPVAEIWSIIVESLMAHHGVSPVHTLDEMQLLQERFPNNIVCYGARANDGKLYAGVVAYVMNGVVHSQYGHATLKGYEMHAMDFLYFSIIDRLVREGKTSYFDFGTSNEQGGCLLNANLASQKEGFGGRGVTYKQWKLSLL